MAKVNDRMTVEEARQLKQGDFVEVRLADNRWHGVRLMDSPVLARQSELDIGFGIVRLTLEIDDPCGLRTYSVPKDPIRMHGYCRAVIKEEITNASHELTEEPIDLCESFHEPTEEEYEAAVKDVIERAVERIMKRTGL
jgi:hypothetical protein